MKILIAGLFVLATSISAFAENAPTKSNPCKYNEFDGQPSYLFKRIDLGPADWYSPFKEIQICNSSTGPGSYVIILEELIKNFRVRNVPRAVLSIETHTSGLLIYRIADDLNSVVLIVSPDHSTMRLIGEGKLGGGLGNKYNEMLKLVPSN